MEKRREEETMLLTFTNVEDVGAMRPLQLGEKRNQVMKERERMNKALNNY